MKNRILIFLAALTLSTTACNDWLDVRPITDEAADVMFDTYQGYKDALTGCYIKMKSRSLYGDALTMTTVEYLANHWRYYNDDNTDEVVEAFKAHSYNDDNVKDKMESIYSGLYNIIVQANSILAAIPNTASTVIETPQARAIIEAEALAIRALCHFEVLRLFGQVPGGSKQVKLPYSESVSRENVKYYDWAGFTGKIETDLNSAAKLLKEHDPLIENTVSNTNGSTITDEFLRYRQLRLNYYAVRALQARFFLYIGNRTSDAYEAAAEVIKTADDGKGFRLATAGLDFNSSSRDYQLYAAPTECLFMISNHQIKSYISSLFSMSSGGSNHAWQLYLSPEDLAGTGMFEEARTSSTDIRFRHLWTFGGTNPGSEEMCQIKKYYQMDDTNISASMLMLQKQVIPVIRLSEMYFIAMELSNDLDEINTLYEKFRIARGRDEKTFTTKDEVLEDLAKEYRREFFAEGQMFSWYKRHRSTTMLWSTNTMTEASYIIPLPVSEFDPNL